MRYGRTAGSRPVVFPAARRRRGIVRRSVSRVLCPPSGRWPFIWDARRRTPRATYPGGGARTRPRTFARSPPLLGLAPDGVCRAAAVADGAVRPYRTLSPLPAAFSGKPERAVCFLWHFPWGRPRRALPGIVFPWSPDFPPSGRFPVCGERPSDRLTIQKWVARWRRSSPRASTLTGVRLETSLQRTGNGKANVGAEASDDQPARQPGRLGQLVVKP